MINPAMRRVLCRPEAGDRISSPGDVSAPGLTIETATALVSCTAIRSPGRRAAATLRMAGLTTTCWVTPSGVLKVTTPSSDRTQGLDHQIKCAPTAPAGRRPRRPAGPTEVCRGPASAGLGHVRRRHSRIGQAARYRPRTPGRGCGPLVRRPRQAPFLGGPQEDLAGRLVDLLDHRAGLPHEFPLRGLRRRRLRRRWWRLLKGAAQAQEQPGKWHDLAQRHRRFPCWLVRHAQSAAAAAEQAAQTFKCLADRRGAWSTGLAGRVALCPVLSSCRGRISAKIGKAGNCRRREQHLTDHPGGKALAARPHQRARRSQRPLTVTGTAMLRVIPWHSAEC